MKNLSKVWVGVDLLRWIVTYPLDKVIRSFNNWGLDLILPSGVYSGEPKENIRTK